LTCPCHYVIEKLQEEKNPHEQSFVSMVNQKMSTCKTEIKTKEVCVDVNCRNQNFCGATNQSCRTFRVRERVCKTMTRTIFRHTFRYPVCSFEYVDKSNCPRGVSCSSRQVCEKQCKNVFDKYFAGILVPVPPQSSTLEEEEEEENTLSFE
jgi:hypothetical protein